MSFLHRLRRRAGALLYDWPRFERQVRQARWLEIRNRREQISSDGRGIRCEWRFTSDLHIASIFPSTGARLMRVAFDAWPVSISDSPSRGGTAEVSFVIGHRGIERLPHLMLTLGSIAGQQDACVECIVVEQSEHPEVAASLPPWVRHIHTPVAPGQPYNRSWAFNVGAAHASGPVLIFHDNDLVVPSLYAAEARARLGEGHLFADLKRFIFYLGEEQTKRSFARGTVVCATPSSVVQNARGGSIAAEADAFTAIGGFDEAFVGWGGEDNDFWERAQTTGRTCEYGYLPMIHLQHDFQSGKWSEESEAVRRYRAIEGVPPVERISNLLNRRRRD